jgi:hypothetical protein
LTAQVWAGIACLGAGLVMISARAYAAGRRGEVATTPLPLEGG